MLDLPVKMIAFVEYKEFILNRSLINKEILYGLE